MPHRPTIFPTLSFRDGADAFSLIEANAEAHAAGVTPTGMYADDSPLLDEAIAALQVQAILDERDRPRRQAAEDADEAAFRAALADHQSADFAVA